MSRAKRTVIEEWHQKAARIIVRENVPLRVAAGMLDITLDGPEADAIFKSESFQKTLWIARQMFYKEIADTPGRDKSASVGLLAYLVQKLIDSGEFDKAIVGLEKLMKAEGWTGAESQINVYAGLSARELAELQQEAEIAVIDEIEAKNKVN
jgi:hypothetical protein